MNLPLQVHGARVGVQFPGAEVGSFVAVRDGHDNVVPGVGGGGADAENLSRDDDVGLEAEVVVGDSHWRVLTLQGVGTADPLTAPTSKTPTRRFEKAYTVLKKTVLFKLTQK